MFGLAEELSTLTAAALVVVRLWCADLQGPAGQTALPQSCTYSAVQEDRQREKQELQTWPQFLAQKLLTNYNFFIAYFI